MGIKDISVGCFSDIYNQQLKPMRSLVALGEIDTPLYTLSKRKISWEGGNRQKTFLGPMRRFTVKENYMGSALGS